MISVRDLLDDRLALTLGWTLLHFVWQGALLGLSAFIVLRLARPSAASLRYLFGVFTLATMLLAPIATYFWIANEPRRSAVTERWQPAGFEPSAASSMNLVAGSIIDDAFAKPVTTNVLIPGDTGAAHSITPVRRAPVWLPVVTATWMVGVLCLAMRLLGGWIVTRRLVRNAVVTVAPAVQAAARKMAAELDVSRGVAILESGAVAVPTLVGWLRPAVLLPAAALSGLSPMQLDAILAHELAHVRRHDYLINLLQSVVETLLFYHPAVWWVSSQVRVERENCCDDLAVAVCGDRLVYVSALAELTSIERRGFALAATDGSLVTRVRRILGRSDTHREPPPVWGILVLLVVLGGGVGTYEASPSAADPQQNAAAPVTTRSAARKIEQEEQRRQLEATRALREQAAEAGRAAAEARRALDALSVQRAEVDRLRAIERSVNAEAAALARVEAELARAEAVASAREREFEVRAANEEALARALAMAQGAPPAPPSVPAVPAPPSVPVPPAPPAPPSGPQEVSISRGHGNFSWSHNGERISVRWTGPFRLSDDERDIAWIEEGARVTISDGWVFQDRLELRGLANGKVERTFYRNGSRRDDETEARTFLATAIGRMIRSGMFASDRVARFLKQGGAEAVLAEIDRLQSDSSYLKRVYYSALLKQAELSTPVLTRVLERVSKDVSSDYDKATVLVQILQEGTLPDEQRVAVARTVKGIGSDYEQRKVLTTVLGVDRVSETVANAMLDATDSIQSAHDRSQVLLQLAQKGGVTPRTSSQFIAAARSMTSDYEQRKVHAALAATPSLPEPVAVEAVKAAGAITSSHDRRQAVSAYLTRPDVSPKIAAAALASAGTISSTHDKAEVLLELVHRGGLNDETAGAFFSAATTITSSHDLARVLKAVAAQPRLSDAVITHLLKAATSISSSYDRAAVLLDILKTQPLSPPGRQLFLTAAEGISSSHDQNRVLAELVRSERRQ